MELPGRISKRNSLISQGDSRRPTDALSGLGGRSLNIFSLVAGCDGTKPGRNYYTEFVGKVPKDCVVLTLGCGKYRFFDKGIGTIGGLPRLMDMGQCNDAYSAILVAVALSKAFNVDVNDLPLSFIISWYEQKAVAILLTLLHLGIKDIRLGPSLPAFVSPNVPDVLVKSFIDGWSWLRLPAKSCIGRKAKPKPTLNSALPLYLTKLCGIAASAYDPENSEFMAKTDSSV